MTTTETTPHGDLIKHFDAKRGWWELLRKPDGSVAFKTPEGVTHNFEDMEHLEKYAKVVMMEKSHGAAPEYA